MRIEELYEEEMYCLFAPDGNWQGMTLAPDFETCVAIIKTMHKFKMGRSYHDLSMKGFKILPVKVSIVQNGDENTPFRKEYSIATTDELIKKMQDEMPYTIMQAVIPYIKEAMQIYARQACEKQREICSYTYILVTEVVSEETDKAILTAPLVELE